MTKKSPPGEDVSHHINPTSKIFYNKDYNIAIQIKQTVSRCTSNGYLLEVLNQGLVSGDTTIHKSQCLPSM